MKFIIVIQEKEGDRLVYIGPFDTHDDAADYGNRKEIKYWWIDPIEEPNYGVPELR